MNRDIVVKDALYKFFVMLMVAMLVVTSGTVGCGSSGAASNNNNSVPATTTITWAAPAAITYGTALSATQLNATATCNGSTAAGTLVYTPASGTVPTAGTQTLKVAFESADTTKCTDANASVTLTVNQAMPALSWTPATTIDNATALATVVNATSSVNGTFTYTATPAGGTAQAVTASTVLSTVGTYTVTAAFVPTDTVDYVTPAPLHSTLTVTYAMPTLTGLNITGPQGNALGNVVYCESAPCGEFTIALTGTGFQQGGTLALTGESTSGWAKGVLGAGPWGNTINESLFVNPANMTSGWKTFQYCQPDGTTCSQSISWLLITPNNSLAVDYQHGELYNLAGNGIIYKWKVNTGTQGQTLTADGTLTVNTNSASIAYDATLNYVSIGDPSASGGVQTYTQNGTPVPGGPNGTALDIATLDGEVCASDQRAQLLLCIDETQPTRPYGEIAVNSPSAIAMGPVTTTGTATENDVMVLTRDGTPTLTKLYPNGASNPLPRASLALAGITSVSSLPQYTGGWYEGLNGNVSGTLAAPDKMAIFVNAVSTGTPATMTKLSSISLPAPAYLLVPDAKDGTFIVEEPGLADTSTTSIGFASLNPNTGVRTPLTAKSSLFGGLAISADGTTLYVCSGSKCETQPNQ